MPITTTIDQWNFDDLLPQIQNAQSVTIVTYSLDTMRDSQLMGRLRNRRIDSALCLITCTPQYALNFHRPGDHKTNWQIEAYYAAINPQRYPGKVETYLNHRNHAKFIICDDLAYVGSANFSTGSSQNFEAGYLTNDPEDIRRLRRFAEEIKARSIPYARIGASWKVQHLLQFAADVPWMLDQIKFAAYEEHETYHDVWETKFSLEGFGVPDRIVEIVKAATSAARALDEMHPETDAEGELCTANVLHDLDLLAEEIESIKDEDQLPPRQTADAFAVTLVDKYWDREDAGSDPELLAEAQELAEDREKKRSETAKEQMENFLELLQSARSAILEAVEHLR